MEKRNIPVLLRAINDVEYRLSRSEVLEEIKKWRKAPERRSVLGGLQPRSLYMRVAPEAERAVTAAHRRIVFTLYNVEPGIGRLMVRKAGYEYAKEVLDGVDDINDITFILARHGVGLLDFLGCRHGRCFFRIYDCLTCSGVEPWSLSEEPLCEWEAGIIEYIVNKVFKSKALVHEVKCWRTGYSYCEFKAVLRG